MLGFVFPLKFTWVLVFSLNLTWVFVFLFEFAWVFVGWLKSVRICVIFELFVDFPLFRYMLTFVCLLAIRIGSFVYCFTGFWQIWILYDVYWGGIIGAYKFNNWEIWALFRLRFRNDLWLVMRFQSEDKGARGECCEKSSGIRVGNIVQK